MSIKMITSICDKCHNRTNLADVELASAAAGVLSTKSFPQACYYAYINKINLLLPEPMLDAVDIFRGDESLRIQFGDSCIHLRLVFTHHAAVQNFHRSILSMS